MALAGLASTGVLPADGGEPALRKIGKSCIIHSQEGRSLRASWRVGEEFGRGELSTPPLEPPPPLPVLQVRRVCTTYRQKTQAIVLGQEGN